MKQKYFGLLAFLLVMVCFGFSGNVYGQWFKTTPTNTAMVNVQYVYDANVFTLPDSAFYLDEKLEGMTINQANGRVTWTPTSINQGGKVSVRITAGAFSETQTFYIYVSDAVVCDEDMVAYWKMDETSGNTFEDFKNGYDAVTSVAPEDTIGVVGMAQKFDPARDIRLSVADNANQFDWANGEDISASVWFKSNHDITSADGPQVFLGRLGASGNVNYEHWWWFGLDTNNYVAVSVTNSVGMLLDGDPGYPNVLQNHSQYGQHYNDNQWHHAVFTLDANASNNYNLKIYVDGVLNQAFNPNKTFVPGNFASTADLNIGWWQNPWSANFELEGLMDEVALYKRALTAQEIQQMYNDGLAKLAYCQPGNFAPIFKSTPITVATEDVVYEYDIETDDLDAGDDLTITVVSAPEWMTSFTDNGDGTATIGGTPNNDDVGNGTVTLNVSDGSVDIEQEFTVAVGNVNDAPVFTSTAVTIAEENTEYVYNVTASDVDAGSTLTFSATTTLPAWLSLTDNGDGTAELSGTPANANVGNVVVTLRVTDNAAATADQTFTIVVSNVNDDPVITGQEELTTEEDENIVLSLTNLTVTDPDNNFPADFTLEVKAGEDYTFSGNTVTPAENFFGELTVNIAVSDLSSTVDGTVTITVTPVNDIPEITSDPITTAAAGTAYQYWVSAVDVEDEELTFEAITLPAWATFTYNTNLKLGLVQGTPPTNAAASSVIEIRVTDSDDDSDTQQFTVTVSGVTAVSDLNADALVVYPSPVKDVLYIRTTGKTGKFQILTLSGSLVKEVIMNKTETEIELSELKSGIYLYRMIDGDNQVNGKFIKE